MNRERLEELLYERADGVLDGRGQAELLDLLKGSYEARKLEAEIDRFIEGLNAVRDVDPPSQLGVRISEALGDARPPTARRLQREWVRPAAVLAAGLLIGAAVVHLLHLGVGTTIDESRAAGAMHATAVPAVTSPLVLDLEDGAGSIQVSRDGASVIVSTRVLTETSVEVVVQSARGSLEVVASINESPASAEMNVRESTVTFISHGIGSHRLEMVSEVPAEPLRFQVIVAGHMDFDEWIDAGNGGAAQ